MFGMSLTEILVVLVILLVVVGPEKLPDMARVIGKGLREIRRATNLFRDTMMIEANDEPHGGESFDFPTNDQPLDVPAAEVERPHDGPDPDEYRQMHGHNRSADAHVSELDPAEQTSSLRWIPLTDATDSDATHLARMTFPHRSLW